MKVLLKLLYTLAFLYGGAIAAQWKVEGTVTDNQTQEPMRGATVVVSGKATLQATQTDAKGHFLLEANQPIQAIEVTHIGYARQHIEIGKGQQWLPVRMEPKAVELDAVVIRERGIERVLEDKRLYLVDYAFYGEELFVIYQKMGTHRPMIGWINDRDSIMDSDAGIEQPRSLFTDCLGNVHVLGEKHACQLFLQDGQIGMHESSLAEFEAVIEPCKAYLDQKAVYEKIRCNGQLQDYLTFDFGTDEWDVLSQIMNKEKIHQLMDPYSIYAGIFSSEAQLLAMTDKEWEQIGKINPDFMFEQRAFFYPIPAPIKVVGNHFLVFDHTNGQILTYLPNGEEVDALEISYHKNPKWSKEDIWVDPVRREAYALFKRGTWSVLREIDLDTGELTGTYEIPYEHISHISVRDGIIYFLYREANYEDVNRLYRWAVK